MKELENTTNLEAIVDTLAAVLDNCKATAEKAREVQSLMEALENGNIVSLEIRAGYAGVYWSVKLGKEHIPAIQGALISVQSKLERITKEQMAILKKHLAEISGE